MKAIVIDEPWISLILSGQKTWEMRKDNCSHRGPVALIRKGSGHVVGTANIVDSMPALSTPEAYAAGEPFHRIEPELQAATLARGWTTPWVLEGAKALAAPVAYRHGSGPVTWVNLEPEVASAVAVQVGPPKRRAVITTTIDLPPKGPSAKVGTKGAPRGEAKGWIDGDKAFVTLTPGNVNPKNGHFYLKPILEFFPVDAIGGSDRSQSAKAVLTLDYHPGQKDSRTDITGENRLSSQKRSNHCFFRERAPIKDFFKRSGAAADDTVVIQRLSSHHFSISLLKASAP